MANPFDQFDTQRNPFDQFDEQAAPQQALAPAGFDVNAPVKDVEAALANMPEAERKAALQQWADARVKKLKDAGFNAPKGAANIIRGTPIGPWLDEISGGIQAGAYALSGGRVGVPYEMGKAEQEAQNRAFDATDEKIGRLPEFRVGTKDVGINIGGDVTTGGLQRFTGGAMAAAVSPVLRPFAGTTVLPATGNAIATGTVYGGVIGAGEGEGWDRAKNAGIGAGVGATIGGASVPISYGIGGLYELGRNALAGRPQPLDQYSKGAVDRVVRAARDDNLPQNYNGGERRERLMQAASQGPQRYDNLTTARIVRDTPNLGDEGMLLDMGPNLRGQANALYNMPGENKTTIGRALTSRSDTAPARIERQMDDVFGPVHFNERTAKRAIQDANTRARPYYDQADNAVWNPQASQNMTALLDRAKAAGATADAERKMLIQGIDPTQAKNTFRYLDYMKKALDDKASVAFREGNSHDAGMYGKLAKAIRDEADNMLLAQGVYARDKAGNIIKDAQGNKLSPYQYARQIGADERRLGDAIKAGQKAFEDTKDGVPYTAARMRQDKAKYSDAERIGFRAAARATARDETRQAATALRDQQDIATLKMFSSPDARDKVREIAINTKSKPAGRRTDEFLNRLDAEAKFAASKNEITGNAATAGRLAAQKEFPAATEPADFRNIGQRSMFGTVAEGLARGLNATLGGAISEARARTAAEVAQILTAQGANREQIVQALLQHINRQNVTAGQRDQIRALIAATLQAPRTQVITANP